MSTNVLANEIPDSEVLEVEGNAFQLSLAQINDLIETETDWDISIYGRLEPIESDGDNPTLVIEEPYGPIAIAKAGGTSYIFNLSKQNGTITWNAPKGISSVAIPDANIVLLLGTAFLIMGLLGRRRVKS
jgi:hypothetical protein